MLGLLAVAFGWESVQVAKHGGKLLNGKFMMNTLIVLYFVLPATSQITTYSFFCQPFDDGAGNTKEFMSIDMLIPCGNARHVWIQRYAMLMVRVYSLTLLELHHFDRSTLHNPLIFTPLTPSYVTRLNPTLFTATHHSLDSYLPHRYASDHAWAPLQPPPRYRSPQVTGRRRRPARAVVSLSGLR